MSAAPAVPNPPKNPTLPVGSFGGSQSQKLCLGYGGCLSL